MPPRNPLWSRDELILALDFYIRHRDAIPNKGAAEIALLSQLLNRMGQQMEGRGANFRNVNGVYMKLMNFRRLDPQYTASGRKGLQRGSQGDVEVWQDYADQPALLGQAAAAIAAHVQAGETGSAAFDADEAQAEAAEGRLLTRLHHQRERSKALVDKKKQAVLRATGKLACEACGFDFAATYGERGQGFMEVHHLQPLTTLAPGSTTKLTDLALLCANCHRMVHVRRPWLSIEELHDVLR